MAPSTAWSDSDDKIMLLLYSNMDQSDTERWDKVAAAFPGKSASACRQHYNKLRRELLPKIEAMAFGKSLDDTNTATRKPASKPRTTKKAKGAAPNGNSHDADEDGVDISSDENMERGASKKRKKSAAASASLKDGVKKRGGAADLQNGVAVDEYAKDGMGFVASYGNVIKPDPDGAVVAIKPDPETVMATYGSTGAEAMSFIKPDPAQEREATIGDEGLEDYISDDSDMAGISASFNPGH